MIIDRFRFNSYVTYFKSYRILTFKIVAHCFRYAFFEKGLLDDSIWMLKCKFGIKIAVNIKGHPGCSKMLIEHQGTFKNQTFSNSGIASERVKNIAEDLKFPFVLLFFIHKGALGSKDSPVS